MPSITSSQNPPQEPNTISVESLLSAALNEDGSLKSAAYKAGLRAAFTFYVEGRTLPSPYARGTARADAFNSGTSAGYAIWSTYRTAVQTTSKPVLISSSNVLDLTDSELSWSREFFNEYRNMDPNFYSDYLNLLLRMGKSFASAHPKKKSVKLRLIAGGQDGS